MNSQSQVENYTEIDKNIIRYYSMGELRIIGRCEG